MRPLRLTAVALLCAAVSACAAHPIVARDPVPAPTGHEHFTCDHTYLPVNHVDSDCEQRGHRYHEERAVVRARG